jgi:serine/threonine-protein kinase PpkA
VQEIQQRNVATINEVGRTSELAFVAAEYLSGGSLAEAMQRQLSVAAALNCLGHACLAIDGMHQLGIAHGNLAPEHFHFRADGALVLADFNTSKRVGAKLRATGEGADPAEPGPSSAPDARRDFEALGRILHALLTGDRMLVTANAATADPAALERFSRLPLPLSPIQPCLDGLLGVAGQAPFAQAPDVLMALRSIREAFEWDPRASAPPGPSSRRGTV